MRKQLILKTITITCVLTLYFSFQALAEWEKMSDTNDSGPSFGVVIFIVILFGLAMFGGLRRRFKDK